MQDSLCVSFSLSVCWYVSKAMEGIALYCIVLCCCIALWHIVMSCYIHMLSTIAFSEAACSKLSCDHMWWCKSLHGVLCWIGFYCGYRLDSVSTIVSWWHRLDIPWTSMDPSAGRCVQLCPRTVRQLREKVVAASLDAVSSQVHFFLQGLPGMIPRLDPQGTPTYFWPPVKTGMFWTSQAPQTGWCWLTRRTKSKQKPSLRIPPWTPPNSEKSIFRF